MTNYIVILLFKFSYRCCSFWTFYCTSNASRNTTNIKYDKIETTQNSSKAAFYSCYKTFIHVTSVLFMLQALYYKTMRTGNSYLHIKKV